MSHDTINPHEPVAPETEPADEVGTDELSEGPASGEGTEERVADGLDMEPVAAAMAEAFGAGEQAPDTTGLRPIGEATYGPPVETETVQGPDNRVQITTTGSYPWRVHCSLIITANDGTRWIGTGWFNGPRSIITAGHCVFIHAPDTPRHGWVRSIQVMPGRNGASLPFGSFVVPRAQLRSVHGWTSSPNHEFDYGAMLLTEPKGDQTGWLGFAAWSDATLQGRTLNLSGYPGDKPSGTQWYHWSAVAALSPRKVYYTLDTAGGQSGSGVYVIQDGSRYAVAIHAYGGSGSNSGTRINTPVFDNLKLWKG